MIFLNKADGEIEAGGRQQRGLGSCLQGVWNLLDQRIHKSIGNVLESLKCVLTDKFSM